MSNAARKFETMSLDDFEELILDMPADEKWELIGGRVVRGMVGARWEHHLIVQNLNVALLNHLRAKGYPCRVYVETFWLKQKSLDLKVFPDLMVRCGPLEPRASDLSDPVVVIEVVSPGSENRDRIEKWGLYRKLPSVQHYVLVARDRAHVEVFSRGDEEWSGYEAIEGLDRTLNLPAIDFHLSLAEVYRDVLIR
jgi:Uma2 family endonuclease